MSKLANTAEVVPNRLLEGRLELGPTFGGFQVECGPGPEAHDWGPTVMTPHALEHTAGE